MALNHAFIDAEEIDKGLQEFWHIPMVYFLYDVEGSLIYIGQTQDIYNRLKAHKQTKEFHVSLLIVCDSYWEAMELEKERIRRYKPFFNLRLYEKF